MEPVDAKPIVEPVLLMLDLLNDVFGSWGQVGDWLKIILLICYVPQYLFHANCQHRFHRPVVDLVNHFVNNASLKWFSPVSTHSIYFVRIFFCLFHKISFWVAAMAVTLQTRQFETKLKCFGSIISRGQLAVYYSLLWFVCSTFGPDFVYFFDGLMVSLRQLPNLAMLDNQPGPLPNCFDKSSLPLCVIIDLWFSANSAISSSKTTWLDKCSRIQQGRLSKKCSYSLSPSDLDDI